MQVLFVGAHADDIEIGAGGTLLKLIQAGHDVAMLILTKEESKHLAEIRRKEVICSVKISGLNSQRLYFLDKQDGKLSATKEIISKLRELVIGANLKPDLVITHASSDNHNDHQSALAITKAVFRNTIILGYYIVNSGIINGFNPSVYSDISEHAEKKILMLRCYQTQEAKGRLLWGQIAAFEKRHAHAVLGGRCEPFELYIQHNPRKESLDALRQINDNSFVNLWQKVCTVGRLEVITGITFESFRAAGGPSDIQAAVRFVETFNRNFGRYEEASFGVRLHHRIIQNVDESTFDDASIFLIGGPVANPITDRILSNIQELRYIIEYDVPKYEDIRIYDKKEKLFIRSEYENSNGRRKILKDFGILTVIPNPYSKGAYVVSAMAIHGITTSWIVEALECQRGGNYLGQYFHKHLRKDRGFQILFSRIGENFDQITNSFQVIKF